MGQERRHDIFGHGRLVPEAIADGRDGRQRIKGDAVGSRGRDVKKLQPFGPRLRSLEAIADDHVGPAQRFPIGRGRRLVRHEPDPRCDLEQRVEALDEGGGIAPVKDDFDRVGHEVLAVLHRRRRRSGLRR